MCAAQCHLTGAVRVLAAGAKAHSFVAGERLDSHTAVFVKTGGGGMRVTSHVEDLAMSACKLASKDRLWCGSCHDAHSVPKPEQRAAWYRSKCLNCHSPSNCKADSDDCVACHMPRNPVVDAEHVVYTNHAIGKRGMPPRADGSLVAFGKSRASDRELGLAYAIVGQRENNDVYRARARTLLEGVSDSEALMYLAELYRDSDRARAIALYERAIEIDPSQLTASVSLGAIRMEQGNYPEAIRLWNDALRKNPALLLVRRNLAAALLKVGDRKQAEAVLRKAADFNPMFGSR